MNRRTHHPGAALALILASALCISTPGLAAQSNNNARQQEQQTPPQQSAQQANQTFTGKVVKLTTGKFALLTGQTSDGKPAGHFLDDQENAQKYDGKQVTVTGTFDEASNTIHVTNIQAA
jgi:starvation-inducible outer membrane lipoprotein